MNNLLLLKRAWSRLECVWSLAEKCALWVDFTHTLDAEKPGGVTLLRIWEWFDWKAVIFPWPLLACSHTNRSLEPLLFSLPTEIISFLSSASNTAVGEISQMSVLSPLGGLVKVFLSMIGYYPVHRNAREVDLEEGEGLQCWVCHVKTQNAAVLGHVWNYVRI